MLTEQETLSSARDNRAVVVLAQATIYNLLASAFAGPPSARIAWSLLDGTFPQAVRAAGFDDMATQLEEHAQGRGVSELLEEMQIEYARLFSVPGPEYVAPYQSMYCGDDTGQARAEENGKRKKKQLWGQAAVAAQKMYEEAGLAVASVCRDIPDHIGLELQFMHHLCSREAEARNAGLTKTIEEAARLQRAFLGSHLLPWLDRFSRAVAKETRHPFYRAMAYLTLTFVRSHAADLGIGLT